MQEFYLLHFVSIDTVQGGSISHDYYLYKLNYDVNWLTRKFNTYLSLYVKNTLIRFDCHCVEQCNDSCDKEDDISYFANKCESTAVEFSFFWSQCWISGLTLLHN